MDKVRRGGGILQIVLIIIIMIIILIFFFFIFILPCSTSTTITIGNEQQQQRQQCTSSSLFPPAVGKIKQRYCCARIFNQLQTYFFLPNLDFRGTSATTSTAIAGEADISTTTGGGGGGEKVKAAVAKSLGKSKETLEDSAKAAANKFKQTLSDIAPHHHPHQPQPQPRPEL